MLFTGHAELNIDAKQRLAIPAKYRGQLKLKESEPFPWVCVPWSARVIRLYTEEMFEALASGEHDTLSPGEDQADWESTFFGLAERVEMDGAGRIAIPKLQLEITGLKNEVVLIGARNRLEIRDRAAWNATIPERFARLPALVEKIESSRRTTPRDASP